MAFTSIIIGYHISTAIYRNNLQLPFPTQTVFNWVCHDLLSVSARRGLSSAISLMRADRSERNLDIGGEQHVT